MDNQVIRHIDFLLSSNEFETLHDEWRNSTPSISAVCQPGKMKIIFYPEPTITAIVSKTNDVIIHITFQI